MDSAHRFSLYRMNLKYMPTNNHEMITNRYKQIEMQRCTVARNNFPLTAD